MALHGYGQTPNPASTADTQCLRDLSKPLDFLAGIAAGGGWSSNALRQPTAYAGVKIGISYITLDLGYDRLQARNGFSTELSGMVPVFRVPGPQADESRNYLRVYAEPGIGTRWGGADFGAYLSAKLMLAVLADQRLYWSRPSPYLEFQRRFPVNSLLQGDNRITLGIMIALCNHCGLD